MLIATVPQNTGGAVSRRASFFYGARLDTSLTLSRRRKKFTDNFIILYNIFVTSQPFL